MFNVSLSTGHFWDPTSSVKALKESSRQASV